MRFWKFSYVGLLMISGGIISIGLISQQKTNRDDP